MASRANPDCKDRRGWTPLHTAIQHGFLEVPGCHDRWYATMGKYDLQEPPLYMYDKILVGLKKNRNAWFLV